MILKSLKMPNHLFSNASTTKSLPARLAFAPFGLWPKLSPITFPNHLSLHQKNSDSSSTAPLSKASLFASVFASNSNLDDQGLQLHQYIPPSKYNMSPIKFSAQKVRPTLLQLDTSKPKDPDGIPAIFLKTCAPGLSPIFNKLFQLS